jgi:hypothetical protein
VCPELVILNCNWGLVDNEPIANRILVEAPAEAGLILTSDEAIARDGRFARPHCCFVSRTSTNGTKSWQIPPDFTLNSPWVTYIVSQGESKLISMIPNGHLVRRACLSPQVSWLGAFNQKFY